MIIFDWDGTLVRPFTAEPLPGVREALACLPPGTRIAIATNQAGPVYRAATQDRSYPTPGDVARTIEQGLRALHLQPSLLCVAVAPPETLTLAPGALVTAAELADRARQVLEHELLVRLGSRTSVAVFGSQGWRKPNPGMLRAIASSWRVDAARLTFVGDMQTDAEAARRVGCTYVDASVWRNGWRLAPVERVR
jgi:phosphoglycolate phosphatase-like HAD superfamily hydrolase